MSYRPGGGDTGRLLLDSVALTVRRGEYVAVMGANGSGKTTLARHLNGLLRPSDGRVLVLGEPLDDEHLADTRRAIGLVFQDPDDQLVAVTVEDELAFGLENRCLARDEMAERVREALELFNLLHVRERATTSLSGGEQQRVAVASVWISEPTLLVLDEPTSMLDRPSGLHLLRMLDDLVQLHPERSVIHITQSVAEAARAGRIVVMDGGSIVLDGPPGEILADESRLREIGVVGSAAPSTSGAAPATDLAYDGPPAVETRDLRHTRRDGPFEREVLLGITAGIEPGRVLAVVGLSGGGKTTFAWHLNRLLEPSSGVVMLSGRDARDMPVSDVRRGVGLTFQRVDLQLFEASALADVAFGPLQTGHTREQAFSLAEACLREVGLDPDDYGARRPVTLSAGEQRRVALAGVLATEPTTLVLDEPTSGLDARGVDLLAGVLRAQTSAGRAVVAVTHDLDFARVIADRVLVVDAGRGELSDDVAGTLNRLEREWAG